LVKSTYTIYDVFKRAGKLPEDFDDDEESMELEREGSELGERILTAFDRGDVRGRRRPAATTADDDEEG
jgi:hypothetical protein